MHPQNLFVLSAHLRETRNMSHGTASRIGSVLFGLCVLIQGNSMADEPSDRRTLAIGGYDRPAEHRHQSRSVVMARNGMVATSHPLAADAGLDVLKRGGNAIDAAIATNAMLSVVEPMSCGIGGDLFVLYWDAKTSKLFGLNASGRSPARLNAAVFRDKGLSQIPLTGPLSWSVPGCVDGWDVLLRRFGTKPLAELLAPSITAAEEGFPVSEIIGRGWKGSERGLAPWPDSVRCYLPEGRAPEIGSIFKNPEYAATLRLLADKGRDAFYTGDVARRIVEFSEKNGGYFSLADFAEHTSEWVEPVGTSYRGHEVWQLPPNGQGLAVLQMLNLIEPYPLSTWGPGHPDWLHLFAEAKKLAYADRARFYADPAFGTLPIRELASKEYAAQRRKRISMDKAAVNVPHGDPLAGHGDTVYLTVVDKDRNCVSFIQSIFHGFGSQVVPGDLGFALQNRGALFSLDPTEQHPNRLEPRKRPFHTIIPGFVTKDGKPWFSFGVMGGDMQPQGQVQVLVNMLDFGLNVQAAGDAARVQHFGSATPTGIAEGPGGGNLAVESGISSETVARLRARGHAVNYAVGSFGGYQGILIDHEHGVLHGATDPRKDGAALGY
jgi:gamma-glutamyltranspeptidase/glutathione hydrolase